jgi:hypothetical protein
MHVRGDNTDIISILNRLDLILAVQRPNVDMPIRIVLLRSACDEDTLLSGLAPLRIPNVVSTIVGYILSMEPDDLKLCFVD